MGVFTNGCGWGSGNYSRNAESAMEDGKAPLYRWTRAFTAERLEAEGWDSLAWAVGTGKRKAYKDLLETDGEWHHSRNAIKVVATDYYRLRQDLEDADSAFAAAREAAERAEGETHKAIVSNLAARKEKADGIARSDNAELVALIESGDIAKAAELFKDAMLAKGFVQNRKGTHLIGKGYNFEIGTIPSWIGKSIEINSRRYAMPSMI